MSTTTNASSTSVLKTTGSHADGSLLSDSMKPTTKINGFTLYRSSKRASSTCVVPNGHSTLDSSPSKVDYNLISSRLKEFGFESKLVNAMMGLVAQNRLNSFDLLRESSLKALSSVAKECKSSNFDDFLSRELARGKSFETETVEELVTRFHKSHLSQQVSLNDLEERFDSIKLEERDLTTFSQRIINFMTSDARPHHPGPNLKKLVQLLEKNDRYLELTNGQRKYGPMPSSNQPHQHDQDKALNGKEIFVGKIPRDIFEDELVELFENGVGPVHDLRLMIDPNSGVSRGYAFVTFISRDHAQQAISKFNRYEIRKDRLLRVNLSIPNVRLFVGNVPKDLTRDEIYQEFFNATVGLLDVIVYYMPTDRRRNRGFCFLEYETHKLASQAKRRLTAISSQLWPPTELLIDWADPIEEPDAETMIKVKVLYVKNLPLELPEECIGDIFRQFGPVERVRKIKDYAFVHFVERRHAIQAMDSLHGKILFQGNLELEVSLAKPLSEKRRKDEIYRSRHRRIWSMRHSYWNMTNHSPLGHYSGAMTHQSPLLLAPPGHLSTPLIQLTQNSPSTSMGATLNNVPSPTSSYYYPVQPTQPQISSVPSVTNSHLSSQIYKVTLNAVPESNSNGASNGAHHQLSNLLFPYVTPNQLNPTATIHSTSDYTKTSKVYETASSLLSALSDSTTLYPSSYYYGWYDTPSSSYWYPQPFTIFANSSPSAIVMAPPMSTINEHAPLSTEGSNPSLTITATTTNSHATPASTNKMLC